jgi:hypothetical protein
MATWTTTTSGNVNTDGVGAVSGIGTASGAAGVLASGILTPAVSPTWTVDALIGRRIKLTATWYTITDNDATTCTIASPPADANYDWLLGGVPIDGDAIVVAAGHTLTWNVDYSAWTTGVAGITITSHATTPAQLTFPTANGTYFLPIKTGTNIIGTNLAAKGKLYVGSSGTPQPPLAKVTISLLTTATIDCLYLDVKIYCTEPTHKYVRTLNAEAIASKTIETDTDVSAEWAVNDKILICDTKTDEVELFVIESFTGSTINLPAGGAGLAAAKNAGAYVVNATRNVEILTGITSAATVINLLSATVDCIFNCAYRNTGITGTSGGRNGRGYFNSARPGHVFGGVIAGMFAGFTSLTDGQFTGVICSCTTGIGSTSGSMRNRTAKVSGSIIGCGTGADSGGFLFESTSLIACCTAGVHGDAALAGKVIACGTGLSGGLVLLHQGCQIGGAGNDANTQDVTLAVGTWTGAYIEGYGAMLGSTSQVINYLATTASEWNAGISVVMFDVATSGLSPQPGQLAWWSPGGYGKSEAYSQGTHGTPPVTLAYVHKSNFETVNARNYIDIPINAPKGQLLTVTVWAKKSANGMTSTPAFKLIDKNREWGHASESLDSETMADDTNWQTLTLSYTPTEDKQIALRAEGKNASGNMYWDYDVAIGGGGGYTYGSSDQAKVLTTAEGAGTYQAVAAASVLYGVAVGVSPAVGTFSLPYVIGGSKTGTAGVGTDAFVYTTANYGVTGSERTGTATTAAAQLATDQSAVLAAAENIDGGVSILSQVGTGVNQTTLLAAMESAHGAGSWQTATGFATPTNITAASGVVLAATGLDAITATEPTAKPTTFPGWVMWLVQRYRRASKTPTALLTKTEAGATVTTQALTDDGAGTETLGAPS